MKATKKPTSKNLLTRLRNETNCGVEMCKDAIKYAEKHNGGYDMMVAYLKAKTLAVYHRGSFDDRVLYIMKCGKGK